MSPTLGMEYSIDGGVVRALVIAISLLVLSGCAVGPKFHMAVDGMAAPEASTARTYELLPSSSEIDKGSLEWQEYANYLHEALQAEGFKRVAEGEVPEIVIFVAYGISDPKSETYSYAVPIFGQTGVSSSRTTGTLTNYGYGQSSYSGTTTYTPTYGVVGSQTHVGTRTSYTRGLQLVAVDVPHYLETKEQRELWRTTVVSTGSSGDLRRVFPILVAAVKPHLGKDTGKQIQVTLTERDPVVRELTGGEEGTSVQPEEQFHPGKADH